MDGPVLILYRTWQVCESGLNSFLQLAERLRVKGLCGMVGGGWSCINIVPYVAGVRVGPELVLQLAEWLRVKGLCGMVLY